MNFDFCLAKLSVGEGASWSVADGALYYVDIWGRRVHSFVPATQEERSWQTDDMPCAVVQSRRGPLIAMERQLAWLDPARGVFISLIERTPVPATHRFNDAAVDPLGRLIIGTMQLSALGSAPNGELLSFADGIWSALSGGFRTINGLAFSPDGNTLYFSDSHPSVATVWQADYDVRSGRIGEPSVFADFSGRSGRPDGAAMAADGTYWIAGVGGSRLFAFAPDGTLVHEILVPVENPTRPAFGGPNLSSLFVTSMSERLSKADPENLAGRTFRFDGCGVGQPVPMFAG